MDRRGTGLGEACVVCGARDARTLAFTRLTDGERIVVCGSHKIAHRRSERIASSIDELRAICRDRRTG
jgi:hypothetical protein